MHAVYEATVMAQINAMCKLLAYASLITYLTLGVGLWHICAPSLINCVPHSGRPYLHQIQKPSSVLTGGTIHGMDDDIRQG